MNRNSTPRGRPGWVKPPGPDHGYRQGPSRINCNEVGSIDLWFYDGGIAVARNADWNIYTEQEANHMIHNGEIFFGE